VARGAHAVDGRWRVTVERPVTPPVASPDGGQPQVVPAAQPPGEPAARDTTAGQANGKRTDRDLLLVRVGVALAAAWLLVPVVTGRRKRGVSAV